MTHIRYKCVSEDGQQETIVDTLPKAEEFVQKYGGSFKIVHEIEKSLSEPYTKARARSRVYQKMH